MSRYRVTAYARRNIAEIFAYTQRRWNEQQADRYLDELYSTFLRIVNGSAQAQAFEIGDGILARRTRHGNHDVYWEQASDGLVVIRAVLHQRMHPWKRLRSAFKG